MFLVPLDANNQDSLPIAWLEFENGWMKRSPFYKRIVDMMEKLARFTVMTRSRKKVMVDRYSERFGSVEELHKRVSLKNI